MKTTAPRGVLILLCIGLATTDAQGNQTPIGTLDDVSASGIVRGWALDPDDPARSVFVHFYADAPHGQGGTLIGFTRADRARPDVNQVTGHPGDHGFRYTLPAAYRAGRKIYAHAIDTAGGPNPSLRGGGRVPGGAPASAPPATTSPAATAPSGPLVTSSGDLTLRGREITLRTRASHGAAITGLVWKGKQFVNNDDHGRQIQIAWTTGQGERYNPTEAGSAANGSSNQTNSRVLYAGMQYPSIHTRIHPAFWLAPGMVSASNVLGGGGLPAINTTPTSNDVLEKRVTVDHRGNPHLVRWETYVTLKRRTPFLQIENPACYMTGEFRRFFTYEPRQNRLLPLAADPSDRNAQWPPGAAYGTQGKPVIVSTANGSHAFGLWTPEANTRYGRWNFAPNFNSGKVGIVIQRRNLAARKHAFVAYLAVGTVQDVARALRQAAGLPPAPTPGVPLAPALTAPPPAAAAPGSGNRRPIGHVDGVSASGVVHGWTLDPDTPSRSIEVHVYAGGPANRGGTLVGSVTADIARPDVNRATGQPGRHGFSFRLPPPWRVGNHPIHVYGIDSGGGVNPPLPGSGLRGP